MKVVAVIPARAGSQRVENKNMRSFGDTTLFEYKLQKIVDSGLFSDVVVNTDMQSAVDMAARYGVKSHWREVYYASSACTNSEYFEYLARTTDCDVLAYCPCTSPFIRVETMSKCISALAADPQCDSVLTVSAIKEFLWLEGKPLNYEPNNAPNSQDLPNVQAINFGFALTLRDAMIARRNIVGARPLFIETKGIEKVDIDLPLDFFLAEKIYLEMTDMERRGLPFSL